MGFLFPLRSLGEHLSFFHDVTVMGFLGGILFLVVSAGLSIFFIFETNKLLQQNFQIEIL
jgi:hypothetical protein